MPESPPTPPPPAVTVIKLAWCCLLASVVLAALMFPVVGGFGLVSNRASDVVANGSAQLVEGEVPQVSTMVDAKGNVIAWLYNQRRFEVPSDQIANTMKLAIVSIEDKRFAEHNGVDWQGTLTGLSGYLSGNLDTRGGSTLEQQYVKNYQLLVIAQTDAEKRAAIETTPARKLREIRMALTLDKTFTKPEILTRYLNLVSFGNGAFGVQDAAQTYFGINASELNWEQAALLAGMVQSTSTLNPYTNPEGALARRNVVLDTMIENIPEEADALRAAKEQPLGILPQPKELPRGCIAAGDRAFFCDYVLEYLARAGISKEQVARGGYLIKTTLDPDVQIPVKAAINDIASPDLDGVASVMSVIKPGKESHPVLAMASNRTYGLNMEAGETMQPQPFSLVGDGAGSVFKVFTTAAAMDMGMGINAQLDAPGPVPGQGPGQRRRQGLPTRDVVCAERGQLPRHDERHRCAGHVAEHRVRQADLAGRRAAHRRHGGQAGPAVLRAARHRPRLRPGEQREPGRLRQTAEPRLVHAGPDRGQRAGAVQRRGDAGVRRHVVPAEPDRRGDRPRRQAGVGDHRDVRAGGARGVGQHPRECDEQGRHRAAAPRRGRRVRSAGICRCRARPAPPRPAGPRASSASPTSTRPPTTSTTTRPRRARCARSRCASAAATAICSAATNPPGRGSRAMKPIANNFGEVALPPTDPRYVDGAPGSRVPSVSGMSESTARQRLRDAGFQVANESTPVNSTAPLRCGGRHVADRADGSRFDHHDPDLQRHPAATTAAAAGRDTGPSGPPVGLDGRRDSRAAADHGAGARPAATTTAATAGLPPPPPPP